MIVVFVGLRKGNCRIVIEEILQLRNTVLRAMVKSHKSLKEQKYLPVGVLEEISKISQNLWGRIRAEVLLL